MKLGDLVQYKGTHWIVRRHDPKRTRMATLVAASGQSEEVAHDSDAKGQVVVIANPSTEWPFIVLKERPKFGKLVEIIRFRGMTVTAHLQLNVDWVPSDPLRSGGAVFFSPTLGLLVGETLSALHEHGRASFTVPANFTTVRARVEKATPKPREPKSAYDHLLDEDEL